MTDLLGGCRRPPPRLPSRSAWDLQHDLVDLKYGIKYDSQLCLKHGIVFDTKYGNTLGTIFCNYHLMVANTGTLNKMCGTAFGIVFLQTVVFNVVLYNHVFGTIPHMVPNIVPSMIP